MLVKMNLSPHRTISLCGFAEATAGLSAVAFLVLKYKTKNEKEARRVKMKNKGLIAAVIVIFLDFYWRLWVPNGSKTNRRIR